MTHLTNLIFLKYVILYHHCLQSKLAMYLITEVLYTYITIFGVSKV
jgi:hypothetical protein